MTIAVLALQGAFAEHEKVLDRLSVSHIELRQAGDLKKPFDALILPGGKYFSLPLPPCGNGGLFCIKSHLRGGGSIC